MTDEEWRLLFACEACSHNQCRQCVHLTMGAWCPHACAWLWRNEATEGNPS